MGVNSGAYPQQTRLLGTVFARGTEHTFRVRSVHVNSVSERSDIVKRKTLPLKTVDNLERVCMHGVEREGKHFTDCP